MTSPVKALLALAAAASGVLGQSQQCPTVGGVQSSCFLWFSNENCSSPETNASLVVTRAGQCNLVPSSFSGVPFSSYKADCGAEGASGVAYYCASPTCEESTCTASPFNSGSCLANAAVFGAQSGAIYCSTPSPSPSPSPAPVSGAAAATAALLSVGALLAASVHAV